LLPLPSCAVAADGVLAAAAAGNVSKDTSKGASPSSSSSSNSGRRVAEGVSLLCSERAPAETHGSAATLSTPAEPQAAAVDGKAARGPLPAGGTVAADAEAAAPASAASASAAPAGSSKYVLIERVGRLLSSESNHMHLHPLLGVDELRLQQQQQMGGRGKGKRRWQRWRWRHQQGALTWSSHSLARCGDMTRFSTAREAGRGQQQQQQGVLPWSPHSLARCC
jgi:hypothetical protein